MRRILLCVLALAAIFVLTFAIMHYRRTSSLESQDPYAALPFKPRVTYNTSEATILNTESEPYLDTRLTLYVGARPYSVYAGAIGPGETATRSLSAFTDERGNNFDPARQKALLLEVKARFGGYEVHKDFPPPPQ